ncbi:MAG: hypothetical protein ABI325_03760 [Ginsengibacter sp.]
MNNKDKLHDNDKSRKWNKELTALHLVCNNSAPACDNIVAWHFKYNRAIDYYTN